MVAKQRAIMRLALLICCMLVVASGRKVDSRRGNGLVSKHAREISSLAKLSAGQTATKLLGSQKDSPASVIAEAVSRKSRLAVFLSVFLPWLYFLSSSLNISTLPAYINAVLNRKTGTTTVSPLGVKVYGNLQGLDSFFTFLTVNLVGVLSDEFGRKPFMLLSSFGLGSAFLVHCFATRPIHFYLAGTLDGLTSCMLSQSQSLVTDLALSTAPSNRQRNDSSDTPSSSSSQQPLHQNEPSESLGIALSRFQGLAIGMAFLLGIPSGQLLSRNLSPRAPLIAAVTLCAINCGLIYAFLPVSFAQQERGSSGGSVLQRLRRVRWTQANPLGACRLLLRSHTLCASSLAYICIQCAQAGVQSVWINYLRLRFDMGSAQAGSTLLLVGIMLAVVPPIVM